jgi:hypothetical protein
MKIGRDIWVVYTVHPKTGMPTFYGAYRSEINADKIVTMLPSADKQRLRIADKSHKEPMDDLCLIA